MENKTFWNITAVITTGLSVYTLLKDPESDKYNIWASLPLPLGILTGISVYQSIINWNS